MNNHPGMSRMASILMLAVPHAFAGYGLLAKLRQWLFSHAFCSNRSRDTRPWLGRYDASSTAPSLVWEKNDTTNSQSTRSKKHWVRRRPPFCRLALDPISPSTNHEAHLGYSWYKTQSSIPRHRAQNVPHTNPRALCSVWCYPAQRYTSTVRWNEST